MDKADYRMAGVSVATYWQMRANMRPSKQRRDNAADKWDAVRFQAL